jgi:hypothetical protein
MKKILRKLLLFDKFEIKTRLSKREILRKIDSFADPKYTDYYGYLMEDGFIISEKYVKSFGVGTTKNSFVPVAKAKISEGDGITVVSVAIRMHLVPLILFTPMYLACLLSVVMFPVIFLLLHFTFFRSAKRLKEALENLLLSDD